MTWWVCLFKDGKAFADQEMIIALDVTIDGHLIPLGFVQASSEYERVCRQFVDALIHRELQYQQGLLCLINGSKGLRAALTKALSRYATIQRCQWHKRENVIAYLPKYHSRTKSEKRSPQCLRQGGPTQTPNPR